MTSKAAPRPRSRSRKFHLVSLGCAKNTVDSDSMAQVLGAAGYRASDTPGDADVLIVNTCGFIAPAKDESIAVLRELAQGKTSKQLLIAAGCMSQRYGEEMRTWVPALDGVIGTRRWMDIVDLVARLRQRDDREPLYHLPESARTVGRDEHGVARVSLQGGSAYLKIADGCRRPCAFCAIPLIKGTAVSRPLKSIVAEARLLQDRGVREIILIAQDTTDYGSDLGMRDGLAHLLEAIAKGAPKIDWIRVMYAYPGCVSNVLIDTMARLPQVLHYLDIPLQHGHPDTLKRMRRPSSLDWVRRTIGKMRDRMPDLAIRSTFIVGYPGETAAEFKGLVKLVQEMEFDRVGVFTYSPEPGTASARRRDSVTAKQKEERRDVLMAVQQAISLRKNQTWVGKSMRVLVEGEGDGVSIGRSYRDAPEVDGLVIIDGRLPVGQLVDVNITGAMPYDLSAEASGAKQKLVTIRRSPRRA
jgi:ribosomal protein S12 methylthiotransferase